MYSYKEIKEKFDSFFEENLPFPETPNALYDPCRYILEDSGKRIRPALCLLSNQLFDGDLAHDVYKTAMALELFHNFTLIHDDIMDHAPLRRGKPTLHHKYGITSGILSGDVMNIISYKCVAEVRVEKLKPIFDLFNRTAIEVCEGQQLDMDYEKNTEVSIAQYLEMIRLKTSVLLACSMKAGAILADVSEKDAVLMYEIGINLGMAFQIQDDYLDTFGKETNTGKAVGGDIRSNKKTYLYLKSFEMADEPLRLKLNELVASDSDTKVAQIIEIYKNLKIDRITEDIIQQYFNNVMTGMQQLTIDSSKKQSLLDLIEYLIQRKK